MSVTANLSPITSRFLQLVRCWGAQKCSTYRRIFMNQSLSRDFFQCQRPLPRIHFPSLPTGARPAREVLSTLASARPFTKAGAEQYCTWVEQRFIIHLVAWDLATLVRPTSRTFPCVYPVQYVIRSSLLWAKLEDRRLGITCEKRIEKVSGLGCLSRGSHRQRQCGNYIATLSIGCVPQRDCCRTGAHARWSSTHKIQLFTTNKAKVIKSKSKAHKIYPE